MIGNIEKYFAPIMLKRLSPSADAWGNPTREFVEVGIIYGAVRQLRANEIHVASVDDVKYFYRLYCDVQDIREEDLFVYKGMEFDVISVNDVMGFGHLMHIDCKRHGS